MTVREYYYQHFNELNQDKKFHFATRIKNYFKCDDFREYFASYMPSQDLAALLADNGYSQVVQFALRKPFFEKYPKLYGIEAALFRVNHLLNEYGVDLRAHFIELVPKSDLYTLADALLSDDEAIQTLSTWAVNVICLTEILFPRGHNVIADLAQKVLKFDTQKADALLLIYLYTHIILCDSDFYTRPVTEIELSRQLLDRAAEIIGQNFDSLTLDVRIEFLVCANMVGVDYPELRQQIATECQEILATHPYIIDRRRPKARHTLNGAEHTNVLFIMSGLDEAIAKA